MKLFMLIGMILLIEFSATAGEFIKGVVVEKDERGMEHPLAGVNVYWMGTATGVMSDTSGRFSLPLVKEKNMLVVRNVGYKGDTLHVTNQRAVHIQLHPETRTVEGVEVVGDRQSTYLDYNSALKTTVMTEKELFKAACCNLSESFQTNPAIDVTYSDAVTGTKQIEMLGLSGIYTQTTLESMPYIRGLISNFGLTFIPGTWISAINVSKGIGTVANGYESITGQIDVDLRKPEREDESRLFLNAYGNKDQRLEANLAWRAPLGSRLTTMTLAHVSTQKKRVDENSDGFLDIPLFTTFNALQRWKYSSPAGLENQFVVQYVSDKKNGGTDGGFAMPGLSMLNGSMGNCSCCTTGTDPNQQPSLLCNTASGQNAFNTFMYNFASNSSLLRVHGKTGYVFRHSNGRSIGLQWSLSRFNDHTNFGSRIYDGREESGYVNLIYQSDIASVRHKLRTGMSMYDRYIESLDSLAFNRVERVPGVFLEYTYSPDEELAVVAGIRADRHNVYGMMLTPRLHIRYTPQEDWVFRFAAGRGYRTANIFTENLTVFASDRLLTISPVNTFGYGLHQESAWNYGFNLTHYFTYGYRDASLLIDIYRTEFDHAILADMDSDPYQVSFASVANGSYSNSAQVELDVQARERLDVRIAYRYLDVKQKLNGVWRERPLTAQHRALVALSYSTEQEEDNDTKTTIDVIIQWSGKKRIPATPLMLNGMSPRSYSADFTNVNMQVTWSSLWGMDLYVGVENLFDFRQMDPVLFGAYQQRVFFDASLVWGPISGRMLYTGLRYRL